MTLARRPVPLPQMPTFEGRLLPDPSEPAYDQGLQFDVDTLLDRRQILKLIGYGSLGAGLLALVGCAPAGSSAAATAGATAGATASAGATAAAAACAVIPEETAGPFPGDGSNGPDVLTASGVVRSDIRSSFGGSTTVAAGVPLTIKLAIQDAGERLRAARRRRGLRLALRPARAGTRCTRQGVTNENYLRGVQADGRRRHRHVHEHLPGLLLGTLAAHPLRGVPEPRQGDRSGEQDRDVADRSARGHLHEVYATDGYSQSVTNLSQVSLATDNVFGDDGGVHELGTVSGSAASGLTVELAVPVRTA